MTKTELQQKIEQTEKLLGEPKAELMKKEEEKKWPQKGDEYLTIFGGGLVVSCSHNDDTVVTALRTANNIFKPSDKAFVERLAKKQAFQRLLEKTAYELNEGWEPDWSNTDERKFCIFLEAPSNEAVVAYNVSSVYAKVYFKSEELARKAIEIIGEDVLKEGFLL